MIINNSLAWVYSARFFISSIKEAAMFKRLSIAALALCSWAFSGVAAANECELTIKANDMMQFDTKVLEVSASCEKVKLNLIHDGTLPKTTMGHNWVLTKAADMQAVATEGMSAGPDKDYVNRDNPAVIAASEVIGGGASTTLEFSIAGLNAGDSFKYFCSFPGHWAIMQGDFIIKA